MVNSRSAILYVRRFLRSRYDGDDHHSRLESKFDAAKWAVKLFYVCSVYMCAGLLDSNDKELMQVTDWDFLWPLAWVDVNNVDFQIKLVSAIAFATSLLAVLFTGSVVARVLFSVFFLMAATVTNSYAGINHPYHAWFWISFVFIFLPSGEKWKSQPMKRTYMMSYLTVFLAAQVLMMLFYTLSGSWKIVFGISAMVEGLDGVFSFRGLSYNLANRVLQTNTNPLLADFAINNYMIAWAGIMSVLYIQFTAIVAAFRPRLHYLWGVAISLFHFGTWLLMGIVFAQHILILVILFVLSPFRPTQFELRKTIADLPIIGGVAEWLFNGFSKPSVAVNER